VRPVLIVLVATAAALVAPTATFLFAFTVLGPLHYFTELAWLQERGAFVGVGYRVGLVVLGVVGAGCVGALEWIAPAEPLHTLLVDGAVGALAAAFALALAGSRGWPIGPAALVAVLGGTAAAAASPTVRELVGVLLPTLIHVGVCTAMFMLHGGRAAGDTRGFWAFCAACVGLCVLPATPVAPSVDWTRLIGFLADWLQLRLPTVDPAAWPRLLGFVYLHHFLNWFDKTERIGWARLPSRRFVGVVLASATVSALYTLDVRWGLAAALLPNVLHVVLEAPLDWRTAASFVPRSGLAPR
jgi:hypothetical protein